MKWLILLIPMMAFSQYTFPLKVSANNRYFVDQNNKPFFLSGDALWDMPAGLTTDSVMICIHNMDSLGFTFAEWRGITKTFTRHAPNNAANDPPFVGTMFQSAFGTNYWNFFEAILDSFQVYGKVVWIFPAYLGYLGPGSVEGVYDEVNNASAAQMKAYGAMLGGIFKRHPNVLLGFGGDCNPTALKAKIDSMARGILDSVNLPRSLRNEPDTYAMTYFGSDTLVNTFNGFYTKTIGGIFNQATATYNWLPAFPSIKQEDVYENEGATTLQVRTQTYQSFLAGGIAGYFMGNCPIWNFAQCTSCGLCSGYTGGWVSHLQDPGRKTHKYFNSTVASLAWNLLVPDTSHTVADSGYGAGGTYSPTAIASDSSCSMSYFVTQHAMRINLQKLKSGSLVSAKWVDAATGTITSLGNLPRVATTFTPPSSSDFVLVLTSVPSFNVSILSSK